MEQALVTDNPLPKRDGSRLTPEEVKEISRLLLAGHEVRAIRKRMGMPPATFYKRLRKSNLRIVTWRSLERVESGS